METLDQQGHASRVTNRKRMSRQTDPRMVRSRRAMTAALMRLLGEKDLDRITIEEIARTANVGRATFFRHFSTKEGLFNALASEEISGLLALTIPLVTGVNSLQSCLALCRYVDGRRLLWTALLTGGAASNVRAEFVRQALACAAQFHRDDGEIPIELGTRYCTGATLDALTWWLEQPEDYPAEKIAGIIDSLIIRPFVRPFLEKERP